MSLIYWILIWMTLYYLIKNIFSLSYGMYNTNNTALVGGFSFFFFNRKFQPMASAPDHNSLSLDQDTNQFLVYAEIESQISYTTIINFTS